MICHGPGVPTPMRTFCEKKGEWYILPGIGHLVTIPPCKLTTSAFGEIQLFYAIEFLLCF